MRESVRSAHVDAAGFVGKPSLCGLHHQSRCSSNHWPASRRLGGCVRPDFAARHAEGATRCIVQEGDGDSVNLLCRHDGSLCKAAACIHERSASYHCQYGLRGMRKNARGRPGASEGKARTCAHATQQEPALVEENWSAEVKSGPCVAARFACLCVVPARNTPPEQICTRAKAKRDANQLATKHEYSMSLHRNITSPNRFAGKGKIETVVLPLRRTAKIGKISPINSLLSGGEAA